MDGGGDGRTSISGGAISPVPILGEMAGLSSPELALYSSAGSERAHELRQAAEIGQTLLQQKRELQSKVDGLQGERDSMRVELDGWNAFAAKMGDDMNPGEYMACIRDALREGERGGRVQENVSERDSEVQGIRTDMALAKGVC